MESNPIIVVYSNMDSLLLFVFKSSIKTDMQTNFLYLAENLLLTEDRKTVKLADFGLAREESLTEMMTAETGTYRWMAPEVVSAAFLPPTFSTISL